MRHGIVELSCIPVRREADDRSEMTNQLLFGELVEIRQTQKQWLHIRSLHDDYEGWIDSKQVFELDNRSFEQMKDAPLAHSFDLLHPATEKEKHTALLIGSSLRKFDGITFRLGKRKLMFNGQALQADDRRNGSQIAKIARKYLGAPYLWGGRSPFGIDCSGFVQVVFAFQGIRLPRDAYQQAEHGTQVNMVDESRAGDLAFFHNDQGRIIHVGIVLADKQIIHAHGCVRIDQLDNFGIFRAESREYSHKLNCIKRISGH